MSQDELIHDVALIGLGGAGIRTMLALRALVEKNISINSGGKRINCRLLAIDSSYAQQEYFQDIPVEDRDGIRLNQNEYLGLLRNGENPWDKVAKDAQLNVAEAVELNQKRKTIEINRSPDRSDYAAMIYASRERMKLSLIDFLANSKESKEHSPRHLKVIFATSLIGDSGSLAYLSILENLAELVGTVSAESIDSILIEPGAFVGIFRPVTLHSAKYLSVLNSISSLCFSKVTNRLYPNHYLVSIKEETSPEYIPYGMKIFTEIAKRIVILINEEGQSVNSMSGHSEKSLLNLAPFNSERFLAIKESFADQLSSDRHFSDRVREFSA